MADVINTVIMIVFIISGFEKEEEYRFKDLTYTPL